MEQFPMALVNILSVVGFCKQIGIISCNPDNNETSVMRGRYGDLYDLVDQTKQRSPGDLF